MDKTYRPLTIPKMVWDKKLLSDTYGELVAQPLEPGFGVTFGNALRRVLLGGVEGSAVTSFVIKGVNNEFSIIPGVVEDAMHVALNIKEIVIRNKTGQPGSMHVSKKGQGVVTVADIVVDDHLELVNKDHVIAHVAVDGDLDIQFSIETGRGYQQAQWPLDKPYQEDGRVHVDAMFSPITKVMFDVEKTRVGKDIDFDRLILRINTDGSINPLDALHYAVSVLRTQLEPFLAATEIPFNTISAETKKVENAPALAVQQVNNSLQGIPAKLLLAPIDELELSVRAHNCLVNANITRVIDLVRLSEDGLLGIKNLGRKSLNEVKDSVKAFGLSLGMNITEEDVEKMLASQEQST
jgi:DNA-directed RNA polymerase subunit alpha